MNNKLMLFVRFRRSRSNIVPFAGPRAAIHVPEDDWTYFFRNEPDLSRLPMPEDFRRAFIANIKQSLAPIAKSVVLFRPGCEVLPGVTTIAAGGHAPGMSAILVHSAATNS